VVHFGCPPTENCYRVFLSHKTEVKRETYALKEKLRIYGISAFVAHEDIDPTKEWQKEIENALSSMDCFVALLTEQFHDSIWTDQEVGYALGRGVPMISVRLGKDPYGFIGKFQALSCSWGMAPIEIAKILINYESMKNSYITSIKNCRTFDIGMALSKLLPFINDLNLSQISKLIEAFNENMYINGCFGFNGVSKANGGGLAMHLSRIAEIGYNIDSNGKIY